MIRTLAEQFVVDDTHEVFEMEHTEYYASLSQMVVHSENRLVPLRDGGKKNAISLR